MLRGAPAPHPGGRSHPPRHRTPPTIRTPLPVRHRPRRPLRVTLPPRRTPPPGSGGREEDDVPGRQSDGSLALGRVVVFLRWSLRKFGASGRCRGGSLPEEPCLPEHEDGEVEESDHRKEDSEGEGAGSSEITAETENGENRDEAETLAHQILAEVEPQPPVFLFDSMGYLQLEGAEKTVCGTRQCLFVGPESVGIGNRPHIRLEFLGHRELFPWRHRVGSSFDSTLRRRLRSPSDRGIAAALSLPRGHRRGDRGRR